MRSPGQAPRVPRDSIMKASRWRTRLRYVTRLEVRKAEDRATSSVDQASSEGVTGSSESYQYYIYTLFTLDRTIRS